jgi:hypothetical protein
VIALLQFGYVIDSKAQDKRIPMLVLKDEMQNAFQSGNVALAAPNQRH